MNKSSVAANAQLAVNLAMPVCGIDCGLQPRQRIDQFEQMADDGHAISCRIEQVDGVGEEQAC